MKRRLWLFLIAALLGGAGLRAPLQADDAVPAAPVTDPAQVSAHYRQVLSAPEFQEPPEAEVDDRLKDWLSDWFKRFGAKFEQFKFAQEMPRFTSLLMSVFVVLTLAGLVYIALRLRRKRREKEIADESGPAPSRAFPPPEFYAGELSRAVAAGDWHAAWLASWRQFLSRLEKGSLVAADRSRTNREYLAQLRAQPQVAPGLALLVAAVDAYDRFVYGRRPIAETDWRSFQDQLDQARLLLHLDERPA